MIRNGICSGIAQRAGIISLPISETAAAQVHRLSPIHADPFDRILIS